MLQRTEIPLAARASFAFLLLLIPSFFLASSSSDSVPASQLLRSTVNNNICVLPEPSGVSGASSIEFLVLRILQVELCFTNVEDWGSKKY